MHRLATHLEIRVYVYHFNEKDWEKLGKFMKNCQSQGKIKMFCKCLRKYWYRSLYFHVIPTDESYQCYFMQFLVRENGKVRENEKDHDDAHIRLYCF